MKARKFFPESMMMSHAYNAHDSHGSAKPPLYQTSTFEFESAEEGKRQFEIAYGLKEPSEGHVPNPIYSRLTNPTQEILEKRLTLWDQSEDCAVFASGMAAISTVFFEFLSPGDVLLYSAPVYGGTDHFIHEVLTRHGITVVEFDHRDSEVGVINRLIEAGTNKLGMIFIETPANPTNALIDIEMCARIAERFTTEDHEVLTVVDHTYMGPIWQHPLQHGADMVVYSATKYIGGHSDLIAGAVLGSNEHIKRVRMLRTLLGNIAAPWTSWLLLRSLETVKLRMDVQASNAARVAEWLASQEKVEQVHYPGLLELGSHEGKLFSKQCEGPGAMISFEIAGGEKEAYAFLNNLELIKLAVSLGSTESLAEHPRTMTHTGLDPDHLDSIGVTDGLVRLSIGVENVHDIISDIDHALSFVGRIKAKNVTANGVLSYA